MNSIKDLRIKDYFADRGDDKISRLDVINAGAILVLLNKQRPGRLVINYERMLEEYLQMFRDKGIQLHEEWVVQVVTIAIWERLDVIDSFAGTNFAEEFSIRFLDPQEDDFKNEDIEIDW